MKACCLCAQESGYFLYACQSFAAGNKVAFYPGDDGHDTEAGAAGGNGFTAGISFACEAAYGVTEVPEVFECLLLHQCEQGIVGDARKLIGGVDSGYQRQ